MGGGGEERERLQQTEVQRQKKERERDAHMHAHPHPHTKTWRRCKTEMEIERADLLVKNKTIFCRNCLLTGYWYQAKTLKQTKENKTEK